MIKACVFDLDGTLLNTLESIAGAGNRMLTDLGLEPRPVDEYRYHCGDGSDTLVKRALKASGGYTTENYEAGKILNRQYIKAGASFHVHPYGEMPEVLAALKQKGMKLAVVSNKPNNAVQEVIADFFPDLFDHVQGQGGEIPVKPDPKGALKAASVMGVAPDECFYFGDTGTDMQTGVNARMHTIGVLWGYRDEEELRKNGAIQLLTHPEEILDLEYEQD